MKVGTLYGIGIGPGDPDLMTFKGVKILGDCSACVSFQKHDRTGKVLL